MNHILLEYIIKFVTSVFKFDATLMTRVVLTVLGPSQIKFLVPVRLDFGGFKISFYFTFITNASLSWLWSMEN